MAAATRLTIEDFERLPEELAKNHELIGGELVDVSGNLPEHNFVRDYIVAEVLTHLKQTNLGRVISEQEYRFGDDAHAPDVSFISAARAGLIVRGRRVQPFVPDLAIEIASQSESFSSLVSKAKKYRAAGVAEVWVLSQSARAALVCTEQGDVMLGDTGRFETSLLPGLSIPLATLFDL